MDREPGSDRIQSQEEAEQGYQNPKFQSNGPIENKEEIDQRQQRKSIAKKRRKDGMLRFDQMGIAAQNQQQNHPEIDGHDEGCLLYTSDAADE